MSISNCLALFSVVDETNLNGNPSSIIRSPFNNFISILASIHSWFSFFIKYSNNSFSVLFLYFSLSITYTSTNLYSFTPELLWLIINEYAFFISEYTPLWFLSDSYFAILTFGENFVCLKNISSCAPIFLVYRHSLSNIISKKYSFKLILFVISPVE